MVGFTLSRFTVVKVMSKWSKFEYWTLVLRKLIHQDFSVFGSKNRSNIKLHYVFKSFPWAVFHSFGGSNSWPDLNIRITCWALENFTCLGSSPRGLNRSSGIRVSEDLTEEPNVEPVLRTDIDEQDYTTSHLLFTTSYQRPKDIVVSYLPSR